MDIQYFIIRFNYLFDYTLTFFHAYFLTAFETLKFFVFGLFLLVYLLFFMAFASTRSIFKLYKFFIVMKISTKITTN